MELEQQNDETANDETQGKLYEEFRCLHCEGEDVYTSGQLGYMKVHLAKTHKVFGVRTEGVDYSVGTTTTEPTILRPRKNKKGYVRQRQSTRGKKNFRCTACGHLTGSDAGMYGHLKSTHGLLHGHVGTEFTRVTDAEAKTFPDDTPLPKIRPIAATSRPNAIVLQCEIEIPLTFGSPVIRMPK